MRKSVWRLFLVSLLALFCLTLARAPAKADISPDTFTFAALVNPWGGDEAFMPAGEVSWTLASVKKVDLCVGGLLATNGEIAVDASARLSQEGKRGVAGVAHIFRNGIRWENTRLLLGYTLVGPPSAGTAFASEAAGKSLSVTVGSVGPNHDLWGLRADYRF